MRVDNIMPAPAVRKVVRDELRKYFHTEKPEHFDTAVHAVVGFFGVPVPTIEWVDRFQDGKTAGTCSETGKLTLTRPSAWKRNRIHNYMSKWRAMVLHELGHLVLWADAETKADLFATAMLR